MDFIETSPERIKETIPQFYKEGVRYFMMIKKGQEVGIYAVIPLNDNDCETALRIFKEHRYKVLSKTTILDIINFPFSLGFKKNISWTLRNSWVKLMRLFKKDGIVISEQSPIDGIKSNKIWFYKEREG